MKKQVQFVLFLTLGLGAIDASAVAQNSARVNGGDNPRLTYGNFDPSQANGLLRLADWDDHHRCDGDHDRDDRNCYYRDRDRYYGRGYVDGYAVPNYRWSSGWYDRKGNFYPAGGRGYYDKHGKWHPFHGRDRDDRW